MMLHKVLFAFVFIRAMDGRLFFLFADLCNRNSTLSAHSIKSFEQMYMLNLYRPSFGHLWQCCEHKDLWGCSRGLTRIPISTARCLGSRYLHGFLESSCMFQRSSWFMQYEQENKEFKIMRPSGKGGSCLIQELGGNEFNP